MLNQELYKRYVWLINTIAESPDGFTFEGIKRFWYSGLREERKKRTIVLLDYNTNQNINDTSSPLSHAYLIKAYVEGLYPYEDQKDAEEI